MKKSKWHKHHKWFGLAVAFFMLSFCLSGVILNHRSLFKNVNVSRKWLPARYEYKDWNGGLLRGTAVTIDDDSVRQVLIYGNSGIFSANSDASYVEDFNRGLPDGADYRQIRNVVQTKQGDIFAVSPFGLYRHGIHAGWQNVPLPVDGEEKLTDMATHGDTLVVLGRSDVYVSTPPYRHFRRIELKAPDGYDGRVSLFRTVWMLHSGELLGTVGKLIVDAVAVALLVLCITGVACWLMPKEVKREHRNGGKAHNSSALMRFSYLWHNRVGRTTIVLTLLVAITGWCLRPPVLIFLALNKVPSIPGTTLHSPNPWNDKLRMVRYDDAFGDWLLSTSEGFYSLKTLDSVPVKLYDVPPVSVMGLNVWQKDTQGRWLCGSFSGMFVWERASGRSVDYFTGKPAPKKAGAPFGQKAVSGYSADLGKKNFVVEYYEGTNAIPQPTELSSLPMSLWNVALEVHSGRIFIGQLATMVFVFIIGAMAVWCLWTGYRIRRKSK